MDKIRKLVTETFKDFYLKIDIKSNLKIGDFSHVTLNLNKRTYSPNKKSNEKMLYINTLSNHPSQIN